VKKIISLLLAVLIIASSVGVLAAFPDVDEATSSWAGEAIDALEKNGVINGYEDGTFIPDGNVTRAEFAKMLCVAFGCDGTEKAQYTDVSGHWAEEYIEKSASMIYTPGSEYNPDNDASRAEIAYAVSKVCGLDGANGESHEDTLGKFTDAQSIDENMRNQVALAVEAGLIQGYEDGTVRGNMPVSRAEAAVLIFRAINQNKADLPSSEETGDVPADSDAETPEDTTPPADNKSEGNDVRDEKGPSDKIYDKLLEKGHIYTLYPQKNLLLVSSVTRLADEDGNDAYRLKYYIGETGDEFESVVDGDTVVSGLRSSVAQIREGDVLFLDTAFWGEIGCLFVLATPQHENGFAFVCPNAKKWSVYPGDKEYEVYGGKLLDVEYTSKSAVLKIQNGNKTEELDVKRSISVDVYNVSANRIKWETDSTSALAYGENTYVFVRYSDGAASEVIAYRY